MCFPRLPFAVSAAEGKLAEAEALQATAASMMSGTLERKMGIATNAMQMSLQDLIRSWDSNKDGEIQPIELRKAIRNSLKIQATNQEIDDLFKSLDIDGMQRRECLERLVWYKTANHAQSSGQPLPCLDFSNTHM